MFCITHFTLMELKKYLPKKVIVIEVPTTTQSRNSVAVTTLIKQAKIDENRNVLVLDNDKIKYVRVKTKWFW